MSLRCVKLDVEIAGKRVCNQLDWSVEPGQVWGILGRNGIGKTTLLHSLAGLRAAQGGDIYLDETPLSRLNRKHIAQKIGVLLQQTEEPFPATVLETVLAGRHPHLDFWQWETARDMEIAQDALQQVDMPGLQHQSIQHLSGGERQRVAMASVLAQQPRYFLLDEPNSHLDLHYQIRLLALLSAQAREHGCAVIMTLHDINLAARFCDHVLLLNGEGDVLQGKTAESLTPDHLEKTFRHGIIAINSEHGTYFMPK